MKKYLLINCCLIIFVIFFTGCNINTNNEEFKLVVNHSLETNINAMSGMGLDYEIESMKKGKYEVNFYAKEYQKGKFVEEHRLYNLTLNVDSKNKKIPVSVYQEDKDIKLFIEPKYQNITLSFFEDSGKGMAMSGLELEKSLKFNEDTPIAAYSIAGEDKSVSGVNIDEDYELGSNEKDLIIFMKITENQ